MSNCSLPAKKKQIRAERMTYRVLMHILAKEELFGFCKFELVILRRFP